MFTCLLPTFRPFQALVSGFEPPKANRLAKISMVAGLCIGAYWLTSRWQYCQGAEIVDIPKKDLFLQTVKEAGGNFWKISETFETLVNTYPHDFKTVGREVVDLLLDQQYGELAKALSDKLKALGAPLDSYRELWLKIVQKRDLDQDFETKFALLPQKEQEALMEASFKSYPPFKWFFNSVYKEKFVDLILPNHFQDASKLFQLESYALFEFLKDIPAERFSPMKAIDPVSGKNVFMHLASVKSLGEDSRTEILEQMAEKYPSEFMVMGQEVVDELLFQGQSQMAKSLADHYVKLGGTLDPYRSLWLKIAEKTKVDDAFKAQFNLLTPAQKNTLYQAAFQYNNLFVYEPLASPIPSSKYSVNLMWIEAKRDEKQEFLFSTPAKQTQFCRLVERWVTLNPETALNIWVDEEMTTSKALDNIKQALNNVLSPQKYQHVHFRNVRSLDLIQQNQEAFSEKMPIYFRVELLRTIVADYVLRQKEVQFFVYTDLDVQPFSNEALFDKRTMGNLESMGFVMAKGEGTVPYENSFFILNGAHEQLMKSHREILIDPAIAMAKNGPQAILEQQVYFTYRLMLMDLLETMGTYGKIKPFNGCSLQSGMFPLSCYRAKRFPNRLRFEQYPDLAFEEVMPQKPVSAPPSHFYGM